MPDVTQSRPRRLSYWVATTLAALAFVIPGAANLLRVPHIAHDMVHLGYPNYFMTILGTCKVLAAIAILVPRLPRLKEWAYAGMIFDLTGAAASRWASGDGAVLITVPLCIAAVVVASWALRPANRTLASDELMPAVLGEH
jgi:uncharacterized membrane protein YphA (DoxX/SURF4 family)